MKLIRFPSFSVIIGILAAPGLLWAQPPLAVGDAPTADKGHFEWYLGTLYQKAGELERDFPSTEVVYGISNRQEFTFEIPYLLLPSGRGFGDAVLGSKFQIVPERGGRPGVSLSFELKLANGRVSEGLGTGALDYDLLLRTQKSVGIFTGIANFGYMVVGGPEGAGGADQERRNQWFAAFSPRARVFSKTELLSEIYWENSDEPGEPHRLAGDIGLAQQISPHFEVHGAVGKCLRHGNLGGPSLRVYTGIKLEFSAPRWQHKPNSGGSK